MFFPDLTLHPASRPGKEAVFVGWLARDHPFPIGTVPLQFLNFLDHYCQQPCNVTFGSHNCEFCGNYSGSGEIQVVHSGRLYLAPVMIHHYVTAHNYRPPDEFITAILATPIHNGEPLLQAPPARKPHPWAKLTPRQIATQYKYEAIFQDPRWHERIADRLYFELREEGELGYIPGAEMDGVLTDPKYDREP